jgi:GTP-binding protein HflX
MSDMLNVEVRGFLVGTHIRGGSRLLDVEASLDELGLLADTAGIHVVGQASQRLSRPDPATFIGSGKVEEIHLWIEELEVDIVIFDDELSPRHQRELEEIFGDDVRVIDRTALILDIFAQHANTREGTLQVTLAQYEYRLPRLTRQWTHLVRQAGGSASARGGVGLRGPGETQLETDRREIRRIIASLKRELEDVRAHRERYRARRRRSGMPVIALVGYTNAGKSTLLNRLSGASVYVADQLFATLDPTTRRIELPGGQPILFTDTVGFIQKLPTMLVAAFRATLEEINEASLLLHVVDASHPNAYEQIEAVERTLADDLGIEDVPTLMVLNKCDILEEEGDSQHLEDLWMRYPDAIGISALHGTGIDGLIDAIEHVLESQLHHVEVRIPYREGRLIALFHEVGIVDEEIHEAEHTRLIGSLPPQHMPSYQPYLVDSEE